MSAFPVARPQENPVVAITKADIAVTAIEHNDVVVNFADEIDDLVERLAQGNRLIIQIQCFGSKIRKYLRIRRDFLELGGRSQKTRIVQRLWQS
jgi:hypothetical protein